MVKKVSKKEFHDSETLAPSTAPGDRNRDLVAYKEAHGLPQWNKLEEQIQETVERHGIGWAEEIKEKIGIWKKYTEFQIMLAQTFRSGGLAHMNAVQNAMALQMNLFSLEEKLRAEGINPIESPEWMKGRELLAKELQFIHKHGLDEKKFQHNVEVGKRMKDDDDMFVVEGTVE